MAPGCISEKFTLMFSASSTGVTFVRAEEFPTGTYEDPMCMRHVIGFGEIPEKALHRADAKNGKRVSSGRQDASRQDGPSRPTEGAGYPESLWRPRRSIPRWAS